jgi:hypothetical protein
MIAILDAAPEVNSNAHPKDVRRGSRDWLVWKAKRSHNTILNFGHNENVTSSDPGQVAKLQHGFIKVLRDCSEVIDTPSQRWTSGTKDPHR